MEGRNRSNGIRRLAMNQELNQLLVNYKDGVPVKIERSTVVMLSAAALMVVALSALIVKLVKKI